MLLRIAAWVGIAALAFLVLSVGYLVVTPGGPGPSALFGVALVVGVAGAIGARVAARN